MRAKEVLRVLGVSRDTLRRYVRDGLVKVAVLPSSRYDYSEESVYAFLSRGERRKTFIYARVSTPKQRKDLENQADFLRSWCFQAGLRIDGTFKDVASGISFEKRTGLFEVLDEVLQYRVEKVVVAHKDRLSRVGFELFKHLFSKFGTEIVVVSDAGNPKLDAEEVFEEIVALLHCYSMKLYSRRKHKVVQELVVPEAQES